MLEGPCFGRDESGHPVVAVNKIGFYGGMMLLMISRWKASAILRSMASVLV